MEGADHNCQLQIKRKWERSNEVILKRLHNPILFPNKFNITFNF